METNENTDKNKPFWDIGYADMALSTMGGPSVEIVEIARMLPPGAQVLDLGCGEGRNSVYLAKLGFEVTAVDISEFGIKKLNFMAQKLGLRINALQGDVGQFEAEKPYDLVMAHTVLHFFPREQWQAQLGKLKKLTRPLGFHSLTSVMPHPEYPIPEEIMRAGHKQSFLRGELDAFYAGWDILRSDYYAKWDSHPGIPMHVHAIEKFVARNAPADSRKIYETRSLLRTHTFDESTFDVVRLGMTTDEVRRICGEPADIHRVVVDDVAVGGNNSSLLEQRYELEDFLYGHVVMQLINGKLTGKYRYFTNPVSIVAERHGAPTAMR